MARGGGGGGRGGGGRSGSRHSYHGHNSINWDEMNPIERIFFVICIGTLMLIGHFLSSEPQGPNIDEAQLSDFASSQYEAFFGNSQSYEDNLLLVFVVFDDCEQFSYMTWVGDHIGPDAFQYLQGEGTWLDVMLSRQVGDNYRNTLSADLDRAVRELAQKLGEVDPVGSLSCGEDSSDSPTSVQNCSALALDANLIEDALHYFRETTGIPIVLVIEDARDIFS